MTKMILINCHLEFQVNTSGIFFFLRLCANAPSLPRFQQPRGRGDARGVKHTLIASRTHSFAEEQIKEQRSPCATQSLSLRPPLLRFLPTIRTSAAHRSVRTDSQLWCVCCASSELSCKLSWVRWGEVGDTVKVLRWG